MEGASVTVTGGKIDLVATDDGINATGAVDETASIEMENPSPADSSAYIYISGGRVEVDAGGDGIDSNGDFTMTGGEVYVSGPEDDRNGALDFSGTGRISGGIIFAAGSTGMAQGFDGSSSQCSLLCNLEKPHPALSTVELKDSSGNVLAAYTPKKAYQSVVISTPKMAQGQNYILKTGEQSQEITLSGIVTLHGSEGKKPGGKRLGG